MPRHDHVSRWCSTRFVIVFSVASMVFIAGTIGLKTAHAQVPCGFSQPYSPFVTIPWFQGEVRATPIWIGLTEGKNTLPTYNQSWNLRGTFNMTKSNLFLDVAGRFQVGPVSFRVHGEQRDFVGVRTAGLIKMESRLEFSGCRTGVDVDLFCRYGIRAGINGDYYWYNPVFTEGVQTAGGKKLLGENPWTVGLHASVTVPREFFGAWPVFEARVSWPLTIYTSPQITDLDIAAGLRGPGTILGNLAVRAGYRTTSLSFTAMQPYQGTSTQSKVDAVLSGWFGELVYYY